MKFNEYFQKRLHEGNNIKDIYPIVIEVRQSLQTIQKIVNEEVSKLLEKLDVAMSAQGVSAAGEPNNLGFEDWEKSNRVQQARMGGNEL